MDRGQRALAVMAFGLSLGMSGEAEAALPADVEAAANATVPYLIRIRAAFQNCRTKDDLGGWGIVVGEDQSQLYVASPDHLFKQDEVPGPVCRPSGITVAFNHDAVPRPQDLTYQASALVVPSEFRSVDVAYLKVPKPASWRTAPPNMADALDGGKGTEVTYLGYKDLPTAPFSAGRILAPCNPIGSTGLCQQAIDGLSSTVGNSGAPIVAGKGVVGLLLTQGNAQTLLGLRIDAVKRIAARIGIPWTLYTASEESQLGGELNSAIRAGDIAKAGQMLDKRFNVDRSYSNGPDLYPEPPVTMAARSGQAGVAKRLVEMGVRGTEGAAVAAADKGMADVLSALIARRHNLGCALSYAMLSQRQDMVSLILNSPSAKEGYDINAPCLDMTPLHWATYRGYEGAALRILDLGADPNKGHVDRIFMKGYPLTNAIIRRHAGLVSRLLQAGARADVVEYRTETRDFLDLPATALFSPVHAAAYVGDIALLDQLVQRGADPDLHRAKVNGSSEVGESPFEVAILSGNLALAKHLHDRYGVSPLGYRYVGELLKDIQGNTRLEATRRAAAARYVAEVRKPYCNGLKKERFPRSEDFFNQQAQCW